MKNIFLKMAILPQNSPLSDFLGQLYIWFYNVTYKIKQMCQIPHFYTKWLIIWLMDSTFPAKCHTPALWRHRIWMHIFSVFVPKLAVRSWIIKRTCILKGNDIEDNHFHFWRFITSLSKVIKLFLKTYIFAIFDPKMKFRSHNTFKKGTW